MMRSLLCLWFLALPALVSAAEPTLVVDVWPGAAPGEPSGIGPETAETKPGETPSTLRVGNVTKPTLSIFRPAAEKANGTAVIICPGVTGIVLKYRVPRRPDQPKDTQPVTALQDAQRAIRLVRSRASAWQLDDKKIGILGFSAGGHLAAWASTNHETLSYTAVDETDKLSGRPDFTVLVYPAYLVTKDQSALTPLIPVNDKTPPMFLVHAYDDPVTADSSVQMFLALKRAKVPAELHVYASGGHGYGMRPGPHAVVTWPKRCEEWLKASNWVK
jgi:dienelactone hydrolase